MLIHINGCYSRLGVAAKDHNYGKIFTTKILVERVNSELLKGIPPKQEIVDATREFFNNK